MQRAIDATLRRIDDSCRVIDSSARVAARRPFQAACQLYHAYSRLTEAAGHLGRASHRMNDTFDSLAATPEPAADARERLIAATARWIDAARQLCEARIRFDETFAPLKELAKNPDAELDPRPRIPTPRPRSRWFLQYCPPQPADRIRLLLTRRRRSAVPRPADAPRRVSRGRAPPFASICLL
jgi:hypothetical protein